MRQMIRQLRSLAHRASGGPECKRPFFWSAHYRHEIQPYMLASLAFWAV